eukprot:814557_1
MALMEFFRWYPATNLYLSIVAGVVLFPFMIGLIPGFEAGGFGLIAKFSLIVPFLWVLCGWRLAYMPFKGNKCQNWSIKICKKVFCVPHIFSTKNDTRPSVFIEILWFLVASVNILVASVPGFMWGSITNPTAGILLALSFPFPQRLLKLNYYHGFYVSNKYGNNKVYDGVSDGLTVFWVVCFTSWDLLFTFAHVTEDFIFHSFHLVPNCVRCIITGQYDLWAQQRVFTFAVVLMMMAPIRATDNPIKDWYLNTMNIDWIMDNNTNKLIREIWGSINVLLVVIHCILWIRQLYRRRKVSEDKVEQILIVGDDEKEYVSSEIEVTDSKERA